MRRLKTIKSNLRGLIISSIAVGAVGATVIGTFILGRVTGDMTYFHIQSGFSVATPIVALFQIHYYNAVARGYVGRN
jgi:hypothetical protein